MITITPSRSGPSLALAAETLRNVPQSLVPYATAAALTRCAIVAKQRIQNEIRSVFDRPTPYTLNSLYVTPASKDHLQARINVKNVLQRGTVAENYLLPQVRGGQRSVKNFELALRHDGFLQSNEYVMPSRSALLDAFGNVPTATQRSILAGLRKGQRSKRKGQVFVAKIKNTRGVWQRVGSRNVKPLFIFTNSQPQYRSRLDFEAIARQAVDTYFPAELSSALVRIFQKTR